MAVETGPTDADQDPVFIRPLAEAIWRYTRATEQHARSRDVGEMVLSANAARQAALDIAKDAGDAEDAAAWIEIAGAWAARAGRQG